MAARRQSRPFGDAFRTRTQRSRSDLPCRAAFLFGLLHPWWWKYLRSSTPRLTFVDAGTSYRVKMLLRATRISSPSLRPLTDAGPYQRYCAREWRMGKRRLEDFLIACIEIKEQFEELHALRQEVAEAELRLSDTPKRDTILEPCSSSISAARLLAIVRHTRHQAVC